MKGKRNNQERRNERMKVLTNKDRRKIIKEKRNKEK